MKSQKPKFEGVIFQYNDNACDQGPYDANNPQSNRNFWLIIYEIESTSIQKFYDEQFAKGMGWIIRKIFK